MEWLEMARIAGNGWTGWKWLERTGNGWKYQEMTGKGLKSCKWLGIADIKLM